MNSRTQEQDPAIELSGSSSSAGGSSSNVLHADSGLHTDTLLGKQINQQRAGEAVPLWVEHGLAGLVLAHTVNVDVEEVRGVQRTALGLGVELCAEDGARLVDHTLVAGVVQVDKVGLPVRGQGRRIYSVTVVLTGDVAASSAQVQSGDVVSTVTILELDGASTGGQSKQLVAQANTEDGHLRGLHQATKVVGGLLAVSWVTGAVGDENTVEVVGDLVDGVVEGEHCDAGATADQTTQNVLLDTTVDDSDVALRIGRAHVERSLGADLADKVDLLRIGESLVLVGVVLLTNSDAGKGRTLLTQIGDDSTGIDTGDGRHAFTSTPLAERLDGGPVAVLLSHIGHNHTSSLEVGGLEILEKTVLVPLGRRHAVVADQGLGEDQDLTTVGRIGQRLGIPNQRGGEDGFTGDVGASSEGLAVEDRTISDREGGTFMSSRTLLTNRGHEARLNGRIHGREGWSPGGHSLEDTSEHYLLRKTKNCGSE